MSTTQADIGAIVETHLTMNQNLNCPGYKWIGAKERTDKKGGGLGFLVKEDLMHTVNVLSTHQDPEVEVSWIRIQQQTEPLYIGLYYGPQENEPADRVSRYLSSLQATIVNLQNTDAKIMIIGDFNSKTATPPSNQLSRNGSLLISFMAQTGLTMINGTLKAEGAWTRVQTFKNPNKPTQYSILDYVLVNNRMLPHTMISIDEARLLCLHSSKTSSDHNSIIITTTIKRPAPANNTPQFTWKIHDNSNWEAYKQEIQSRPTITQDQLQQDFQSTYTEWENQTKTPAYIHIGRTNQNKKHPTLPKTRPIKKAKKRLKFLKKQYNRTQKIKPPVCTKQIKQDYWQAHTTLRNEITQQEAKRVTATFQRIITTGGVHSKHFWKIKRSTHRKNMEDLYCVKNQQGQYIHQPDEVKDHIASYYQTLYQPVHSPRFDQATTANIEQTVNHLDHDRSYESDTINQPISLDEVKQAISTLPCNKSAGPDDIKYEFLRYGGPKMTSNIHTIMAYIFQHEISPHAWHTATMTSTPKGNRQDPELVQNKRGLTISSAVGKTFERVLLTRIAPRIPFTEAQAGARKGRSTTDQQFILKSIAKDRMDQQLPTYVAFLDIHKAYDQIWKPAVWLNLWQRGIRGKMWRVLKLLNSNLSAKVRTRYGLTQEFPIAESLRQGGVLAGTEFASLIDHLEEDLQHANIGVIYGRRRYPSLLLMDDIVLMASTQHELQEMLDLTEQFACKWHLTFGDTKCKVMVFASPANRIPLQWHLGTLRLKETDQYRYLGEIITNNLRQTNHINQLRGKAISIESTIMSAASDDTLALIQLPTILQLYDKCMLPAVLYNSEPWMLSTTEARKLQTILFGFLKRMLKTPTSTSHLAIQQRSAQ